MGFRSAIIIPYRNTLPQFNQSSSKLQHYIELLFATPDLLPSRLRLLDHTLGTFLFLKILVRPRLRGPYSIFLLTFTLLSVIDGLFAASSALTVCSRGVTDGQGIITKIVNALSTVHYRTLAESVYIDSSDQCLLFSQKAKAKPPD